MILINNNLQEIVCFFFFRSEESTGLVQRCYSEFTFAVIFIVVVKYKTFQIIWSTMNICLLYIHVIGKFENNYIDLLYPVITHESLTIIEVDFIPKDFNFTFRVSPFSINYALKSENTSLLAFMVICLAIIGVWPALSHRLLWFWWIES